MSVEPDALAVVNQLKDLAADPMNRRAIVQDQGCLPGLILFLDNPNPQVVYAALLAIRYLAECRANREKLKGELGMMLSLQNVVQKSTTPGETKLLASEIYELLQATCDADSEPAEDAVSSRRKAQFFLGSSNKRAKTVILHIDGLDDWSRRSLCEEALLKIRGVISFTFQMAVKRCIVRIRSDLKAESLASAIASTQVMSAQQVVRGENGDEVSFSFSHFTVSKGHRNKNSQRKALKSLKNNEPEHQVSCSSKTSLFFNIYTRQHFTLVSVREITYYVK
ncbi:armadillo repeat-containing protein 1 isoform X1 [Hippoglossus stenolepis]|uniref:armadillo repeat-containing protein 1 isoform X1 n=1 Tax=Hippoglossus stenolepis TaxID=195615 RepID=UPI00159CA3A5|nr:armadillo repeat-containing protein 1 isoform X1 [Hippoglossus stenolepis]XP_035025614.1 armadillo repeat-containing protein 1 isoform X1 [Hippoglossus stenolepis]XP_035025615.1 armadillo repeat-containing protein 1 isoform X1 [Hippoglossus stenolepis]XP_047197932.1 armadillo repeat-containing protein 1 isoform X1 [Hippoglossus stenolepis]